MFVGLLKRLLLAAAVLALLWWLMWGLTNAQIDQFQRVRAKWLGHAKVAEQTVETGYKKIKS